MDRRSFISAVLIPFSNNLRQSLSRWIAPKPSRNQYLSVEAISLEAIKILSGHHNISARFDERFPCRKRIGSTFMVRRPPRYVVKHGASI